jgi:hypothetical protein
MATWFQVQKPSGPAVKNVFENASTSTNVSLNVSPDGRCGFLFVLQFDSLFLIVILVTCIPGESI